MINVDVDAVQFLNRTASVAKSLTATVVLSLMEDGKLDLDQPVQRFVPEFSEKRWPVTSRQLLGHLGGIRHYKSSVESSATDQFFNLKSALSTFASGTSTILLLYPDSGTCVAIMSSLQRLNLLSTAVAIAEQLEPPQYDYQPAIDKLEAAVRYEVVQKDLPAFSISLVDRDQVVWAGGLGFQDADKKIPATAETVYRVGSVSKLFTDIAVLQLVEEGQLDIDAPVQTYLPDFKPQNPFGVPQTLRHMMSHRSGLVRESPVGNYFDPNEPTLAETVASLNQTSLVYQPGTKTKIGRCIASATPPLKRCLARDLSIDGSHCSDFGELAIFQSIEQGAMVNSLRLARFVFP